MDAEAAVLPAERLAAQLEDDALVGEPGDGRGTRAQGINLASHGGFVAAGALGRNVGLGPGAQLAWTADLRYCSRPYGTRHR